MKWTKEQWDAITLSGSNILVSAGAGSGKTAVLSERVLDKIDHNIHLNELLILTFTNAAAREMKLRIRKKVKDNKEELNRLNSAYITTFDSFALSVVKKYHYLNNISKDIKITDESIISLTEERLLSDLFEELYQKEDNDFLSLIDKYCLKDDKVLKNNILLLARKIDGMLDKESYLNNIKENYFTENNIKNIYLDYLKYLDNKRNVIKIKLNNLGDYFDLDYVNKVEDSLKSFLNIDLDKLYQISKVVFPRIPNGTLEDAKNYKESLKQEIDSLCSLSKYGSYEDIKKDILMNEKDILIIVKIIEKFNNKLASYKKINNLYTFNDIAKLAIETLKKNEDARNELKYSFKEIMIDEYQDTNDIQDAFIKLIANNNVYMVGDIKQSIYGFRGSNPYIFKEKYDSYSNSDLGIKIDLIKNFRSRKEVLENVNEIFSLIMDDTIGGASYKKSHMMNYGNLLYDEEKEDFDYNINILEYDNGDNNYLDEEIEIFAIAKDILKNVGKVKVFDKKDNKLRLSNYSDYVIILDRSKHFNTYKKIFEFLNIPLTILKDDELTGNYDILIIKNIIELIIKINQEEFDNIFIYDFVSILRSFLYETSDQEIYDIILNKNFKETKLYKDLLPISNFNSKTIMGVLDDILLVTDFYDKIVKIGGFNDLNTRIEYLYNIANSLNDLGYTLNDFNDYLDELLKGNKKINYQAFVPQTNSVKIMTIHGSKGLEYPFCYYADLNHNFNIKELNEKFIASLKYGIIIPTNLEKEKNSIVKILYKDSFVREEISEKERLLYVALTRAREKITIIIPNKSHEKLNLDDDGVILNSERLSFNKLVDYIYAVKNYLPKYFKELDINELGLSKDYLYPKKINDLEIDNPNIIEVEEIQLDSKVLEDKHYSKESLSLNLEKDLSKVKYGVEVHEILEYLDFKNPIYSNMDDYLKRKIQVFLNNDIFKNINNAKIYKEYEFIYDQDNEVNHGIIDLMLEYNNYIDIVDYKLKNIDDEGYKKQLLGYKKYIENISNKPVNIYLYSIIDEVLRKID